MWECVYINVFILKLHVLACKLGGTGKMSQQTDLQGGQRSRSQRTPWTVQKSRLGQGQGSICVESRAETMSKDPAWGPRGANGLALRGQLQALWERGIPSPLAAPSDWPTFVKCPEGGPISRWRLQWSQLRCGPGLPFLLLPRPAYVGPPQQGKKQSRPPPTLPSCHLPRRVHSRA